MAKSVDERVKEIIVEQLGVEEDDVTPAAKAGLIGFTKASARELAHWSILVNAVAPGLIETDMTATLPAAAREALLAQIALKRIGTAREVAEVVRFLAGDGAAYITGQVFHVNGGLYM